MKIHKVIVPLLIFWGSSLYANDNEVEGFTEYDCDGDSHVAASYSELTDLHNSNDNEWKFKSYWYTNNKAKCMVFEEDMEELVVTGTRLPGGGYSGGGGSTGGYSGGGSTNNDRLEALQALVDALEAENFDEVANQALFECWWSKVPTVEAMTNWEGRKTQATWQTDVPFQWVVEVEKPSSNAMANVDYVDGVLTATLYRKSIANFAKARNAKFSHVALAVQLHEMTHIMQWFYDARDSDGIRSPSPYEYFGMEQEAYHYPEAWYRILLGSPPFLPEANVMSKSYPGGFRPKRREYQKLETKLQDLEKELKKYKEKIADGEELSDEEIEKMDDINKNIKATEATMEEKAKWFKKDKNLPGIDPIPNRAYDRDAMLDCTPPEEDDDDNGDGE